MLQEKQILTLVWFFLLSVIAILLPILLRPSCSSIATTNNCCPVCPVGSIPVCGVGASIINSLPIITNITTSEIMGSTILISNGNTITTKGELRFEEAIGANYVGFSSPNAVTTSVVWKLPPSDGASGQIMATDGSGNLSWITAGVPLNATQSIFFNGSTLSNPAYVLLPVLEISETFNGTTLPPPMWPSQFVPLNWIYNGSGQVFLSPANASLGNYFRWDNLQIGSSGIYSFRAFVATAALTIVNYGQFQVTVDGVPTGSIINLSAPGQSLVVFNNISITAGNHAIGIQCVLAGNAGGFGGQFLAEFFLLVQIS